MLTPTIVLRFWKTRKNNCDRTLFTTRRLLIHRLTTLSPHDQKSSRILGADAEAILRLSADIALDGIESAGQAVAWRGVRRGSRDKKCLALSAPKCASRNIPDGHLYHAINLAVRSHPHNTAAKVSAVPQVAFGIDGRAVRKSAVETLKERDFVFNRACSGIVVICPNDVRKRISGIETTTIGAPRQGVGDANVPAVYGRTSVRIERCSTPSLPPASPDDPSGFTLLRMEPTHNEPRGSARASLRRTLGHPSREKIGLCRRSEAGSHRITPEPSTTAITSSRSVSASAVTGSSKNHVRTQWSAKV